MKTISIKACVLAVGVAVFGIGAQGAAADPKPRPSKPADPNAIVALYLGQTWTWSKGGSYWGQGGKFAAIWEDEPVADGKWYVTTRGTLCYEAVWLTPESPTNDEITKLCWQHVADEDGQIWQKHHEKNDWYIMDVAEDLTRGNTIQKELAKRRRAVGL